MAAINAGKPHGENVQQPAVTNIPFFSFSITTLLTFLTITYYGASVVWSYTISHTRRA